MCRFTSSKEGEGILKQLGLCILFSLSLLFPWFDNKTYGYLVLLKGDLEVMVSSTQSFSELSLKDSLYALELGFIFSILLALLLAYEALKALMVAKKRKNSTKYKISKVYGDDFIILFLYAPLINV